MSSNSFFVRRLFLFSLLVFLCFTIVLIFYVFFPRTFVSVLSKERVADTDHLMALLQARYGDDMSS